MHNQLFYELLSLSAVGFSMLALGGAHWLLKKSSDWLRFGVNATIVGAGIGGSYLLTEPHLYYTQRSAVLLVGMWALLSATLWSLCASATVWLVARTRQPLVRGGLSAAFGVAVLGFAMAKYEHDDNALLDEHMAYLETISSRPTLTEIDKLAKTDLGNELKLGTADASRAEEKIAEAERRVLTELQLTDKVIRLRAADDSSNCHGWIFTGGKYWIEGAFVSQILEDNNYQLVTDPKPGDIVIYHEGDAIAHTGIVRYAGEGLSTMVESKWGWMGVYLHRVDQSCYGKDFAYFRSTRQGHLLAGINESNDTPARPSSLTELHADTSEE